MKFDFRKEYDFLCEQLYNYIKCKLGNDQYLYINEIKKN